MKKQKNQKKPPLFGVMEMWKGMKKLQFILGLRIY